jgi:chromosome partitioning protein
MGSIVTVAQQKGGAGKTTLSAHLAVALSDGGKRPVALLDVDPQGSLGEWYEAREATLGEAATGLDFRTASGWGARREAQRLARDNDYVVVDTPPHADLDARPAIECADLVIVPVQPTPPDLWATKTTLDMLADGGPAGVVVFNRVPPRGKLAAEMAEAIREFAGDIATTSLGNRVAYAGCFRRGLTAIEAGGNAKAAEEIRSLAAEIAKRLS